jgi:peptidoglycan/LPS O-acetylase OafA/YrhL
MDYRREVDGLRAIAVLPVIFFHAGLQLFSGGFVGVDVFFVISGYLITSIILNALWEGKFSVLDFYERRARRILPALFLVIAISFVFAYFWMLPDELENFGQSVVATLLFSNNILLALTTGYWERAAEFKPLLHTWSLGVEEQYYFLIPLVLIFLHRFFPRSVLPVLAIAFFVSLGASVLGAKNFPASNFYLLPTRAWELLLGSLVAMYLMQRDRNDFPKWLCEIASMSGLLAILFAVFFFSANTPTPSLYTLLPTLGAALLILFTRQDVLVFKILGSRFAVGIGLISYSAYLLHWPMFSFARIYFVESPSAVVMLTLAILSIFLAFLCWRYVEQPFRNRQRISRRFIFVSSTLVTFLFVGAGYHLHKTHGLPSRMYSESVASEDEMYISYNQNAYRFQKDAFVNKSGQIKLLISGDSFARDFVNMVHENFDSSKFEMIYRTDLRPCFAESADTNVRSLVSSADVLVFAFAMPVVECVDEDIASAKKLDKKIFFVGSKHFGHNLNWIVRVPAESRARLYNPLLAETIATEELFERKVPAEHAISLLKPIIRGNSVLVTDDLGRLLSADRAHVTRFGAKLIGREALVPSAFGALLSEGAAEKTTR